MAKIKFYVHDDDGKIVDKDFDKFEDAYDYAQDGLVTFIFEVCDCCEDDDCEDCCEKVVWSWDDTHNREDAINKYYHKDDIIEEEPEEEFDVDEQAEYFEDLKHSLFGDNYKFFVEDLDLDEGIFTKVSLNDVFKNFEVKVYDLENKVVSTPVSQKKFAKFEDAEKQAKLESGKSTVLKTAIIATEPTDLIENPKERTALKVYKSGKESDNFTKALIKDIKLTKKQNNLAIKQNKQEVQKETQADLEAADAANKELTSQKDTDTGAESAAAEPKKDKVDKLVAAARVKNPVDREALRKKRNEKLKNGLKEIGIEVEDEKIEVLRKKLYKEGVDLAKKKLELNRTIEPTFETDADLTDEEFIEAFGKELIKKHESLEDTVDQDLNDNRQPEIEIFKEIHTDPVDYKKEVAQEKCLNEDISFAEVVKGAYDGYMTLLANENRLDAPIYDSDIADYIINHYETYKNEGNTPLAFNEFCDKVADELDKLNVIYEIEW